MLIEVYTVQMCVEKRRLAVTEAQDKLKVYNTHWFFNVKLVYPQSSHLFRHLVVD